MSPPEQPEHTRASRLCVLGLALAHALLTVLLARARYLTAHHHTYDLALYARLAWGLVHGQAWDPILGGGALSGHLALVLVPLGALGALIGTVPALLLVQSTAIAAAAWPLSRIAARRGGPWAGVLCALAWLLQPNLGHVASYEFHPGTVGVLPLAWALELADRMQGERERTRAAQLGKQLLLACVLTVGCRASFALQTGLLGLLGLLLARREARSDARSELRRHGRLLALGSGLWFAGWLASASFDTGAVAAGSSLDQHYGVWGGSPLGALGALFTAPGTLLSHLFAPERISYLPRVLLPLALLPLLAPSALLVALPPLALNLLSAFPTSSRLDSHYLTPALPALLWAAVLGGERLARRLSSASTPALARHARALPALALCVAAFAANLVGGGLPWSHDFAARDFRPNADSTARFRALAVIGAADSVQAPDALLPHLIERAAVFRAPPPERRADVIVLDVKHRRLFARREDLLRTVQEPLVRAWLARDDHALVLAARDLLVLRRGKPPRSGLSRRYLIGQAPIGRGRRLTACLELQSAALEPSALTLDLVAGAPCPSDLAVRFGAESKPTRVDLLFDGLLSPKQLRAGDLVRSRHPLAPAERTALARGGLHVGVLRSSGARPEPQDPIAITAPLRR